MNIKRFWLNTLAAVFMAASIAGCSSSDSSLFDYLSTDGAIVGSISLNAVAENAGFEVAADGSVKPTEAFSALATKSDEGWLIEAVQLQGVDLDKAFFTDNRTRETKAFIVAITDKAQLEKYLTDNGFTAADTDVYTNRQITFVIDGDNGVLLDDDASEAKTAVAEMKKAAEKAPLKKWQKELLMDAMTITVLSPIDVAQGAITDHIPEIKGVPGLNGKKSSKDKEDDYIACACRLSGADMSCKISKYASDGTMVEVTDDTYSPATSLLQYVSDDDVMVTLIGVPEGIDFSDLLSLTINSGAERMVINKVLSSVRSVMLAAGPLAGKNASNLMEWNGVLAVEFDQGKASDYFKLLCIGAKQIGARDVKVSDTMISLSYGGLPITAKCEDNAIIASVNPRAETSDSAIASPDTFDASMGGCVVEFGAQSAIAKMLNVAFGIDGSILLESDGLNMNVKLTGTNKKFLETIIETIAGNE